MHIKEIGGHLVVVKPSDVAMENPIAVGQYPGVTVEVVKGFSVVGSEGWAYENLEALVHDVYDTPPLDVDDMTVGEMVEAGFLTDARFNFRGGVIRALKRYSQSGALRIVDAKDVALDTESYPDVIGFAYMRSSDRKELGLMRSRAKSEAYLLRALDALSEWAEGHTYEIECYPLVDGEPLEEPDVDLRGLFTGREYLEMADDFVSDTLDVDRSEVAAAEWSYGDAPGRSRLRLVVARGSVETDADGNGYELRLRLDEYPSNPREEDEPLSKIAAWHRRYMFADEDLQDSTPEQFREGVGEGDVLLPLYLYDHGCQVLSISEFGNPFPDPGWDSGQIGYVWIPKADYEAESLDFERAKSRAISELKEYADYVSGSLCVIEVHRMVEGVAVANPISAVCDGVSIHSGPDDLREAAMLAISEVSEEPVRLFDWEFDWL